MSIIDANQGLKSCRNTPSFFFEYFFLSSFCFHLGIITHNLVLIFPLISSLFPSLRLLCLRVC